MSDTLKKQRPSTPTDSPIEPPRQHYRKLSWFAQPVGRAGQMTLIALIIVAPWWLFGLGRLPAWIAPESRISPYVHQNLSYRLHSDDFAYLGSSRNWSRMVDNLFVPHNTHICPSWRFLTWCVVQAAGELPSLPIVMKTVSYLAIVLVMLATGYFVAYESRMMTLGFAASVLVGVTSIQRLSTIWYSAGQTLWAGLFVLISLILAQEALRHRRRWPWLFVFMTCWAAGGFWTIGHAAGPVTAIYVIASARGKNRMWAAVPVVATVTAVAIALVFGGEEIDASTSFHGRSTREALNVVRGLTHTCHSIIETMILGNLGIYASTTDLQSVVLTLILAGLWCGWHVRSGRPITTLEWTGAALCLSAYWVEWSFRGYFLWPSLKGVVKWYDSIPQIGWILFLTGWMDAVSRDASSPAPERPARLSRKGAACVLILLLTMMLLHQSDVDRQLIESAPPLTAFEIDNRLFPIPELQRLRAVYLWDENAKRLARHLSRMKTAETIARQKGWSVTDVSDAFGRVKMPGLPKAYDGVFLLNLELTVSKNSDTTEIRRALTPLLAIEPEAKPPWLSNSPQDWPPKGWGDE